MSQIYISFLVSVIVPFLPKIGLEIGNDALTTTITTLVAFAAALWGMYRRYTMGGINVSGTRK